MLKGFKSIAVLCGGASSERDASLESGKFVTALLRGQGFWVSVIDPNDGLIHELSAKRPDLAIIALHGKGGEDGAAQHVLDSLSIPYTGSSPDASAIAMLKHVSKAIWLANGISTPRFHHITCEHRQAAVAAEKIGYPVIVKPSAEGCSAGLTLVQSEDQLSNAVMAASGPGGILLEQFIDGAEYTVPLLGNEAFEPVEIRSPSKVFDRSAKFDGTAKYIYDAVAGSPLSAELRGLALRAFQAIGAGVYGRVDVRVCERTGSAHVLEVNTIPGMTPHSIYLNALRHAGVAPMAALERIVAGSLQARPLRQHASGGRA